MKLRYLLAIPLVSILAFASPASAQVNSCPDGSLFALAATGQQVCPYGGNATLYFSSNTDSAGLLLFPTDGEALVYLATHPVATTYVSSGVLLLGDPPTLFDVPPGTALFAFVGADWTVIGLGDPVPSMFQPALVPFSPPTVPASSSLGLAGSTIPAVSSSLVGWGSLLAGLAAVALGVYLVVRFVRRIRP